MQIILKCKLLVRYFFRKRSILRGILFTYIKPKGQYYRASEWFENSFYTQGVSDSKTISHEKNIISTKYHYCSIELQILKHIINKRKNISDTSVLDIGSGSGHWINFYKSIGAEKTTGIDVSTSSIDYLNCKYSNDVNSSFHLGKAVDVIDGLDKSFEIVNAVGVMFHIVDDAEWNLTIKKIAKIIPKNGLFIVGGHFGIFNGLNVQIDKNGQIFKRLRSKNHWKKKLKKEGFTQVTFYKNNAIKWIDESLPQSNIMIASK